VLFLGKKETVEPTGTIQINSTPSGAEVFLDDKSTGQITNCVLTDVTLGSHAVEVAREGYRNERRDVVVVEGQTATVSVDLVKHTLIVTEPTADVIWVMGDQVEIKWETGEESSAGGALGLKGRNDRFDINKIDRYKQQTLMSSRSFPVLSEGQKKKENGGSFDADSRDFNRRDKAFSQPKTRPAIVFDRFLPAPVVSWPKGGLSEFWRERPNLNSYHRSSAEKAGSSGDFGIQALNNVKIQLYGGDSLLATIVDAAPNSGLYTWTVSTSLQEGTNYKVKVFCADEPGVADESEEFMITPGYKFITKWGSQGDSDGMFIGRIWGIAISSYVYVTNFEGQRIQKFTTDGTFVTKWGSQGSENGKFNGPAGIDPDSAGNLYVVDAGNHRIQKFSSTGDNLSTWGGPEGDNGFFHWPYYIALDSSGNCYVSEQENHRVQKFKSDGTYITKWGGLGSGDGQFNRAYGLAVDLNGYVYVVDSSNHRIQKFDSIGQFVTKWGVFGTADGEFNRPIDIDIDSAGYIYVSDSINNRIQKFDSNGKFITKWGSGGGEDGQLDEPYGIAVDESGNVYVGDWGNFRIQKFGLNNK